jgi:hypothetical protein
LILHPNAPHLNPIDWIAAEYLMPKPSQKGTLRAFWDWFVLFSGISTASNLSRTRRDPVLRRGLFLFRSGGKPTAGSK